MNRRLLALVFVLAGGCVAPQAARWTSAEPAFVAPRVGFEVVPPPGWVRWDAPGSEVLVMTRDGIPLQRIFVSGMPVGKSIFRSQSRAVTAGMSNLELAEAVVDGMRAIEAFADVVVLEDAPATLSGGDGFRLVLAYTAGGLRKRIAFYGLLTPEYFYRLTFEAPERHYFATDLPTFEEFVRSFRLRTPAAAGPVSPGERS